MSVVPSRIQPIAFSGSARGDQGADGRHGHEDEAEDQSSITAWSPRNSKTFPAAAARSVRPKTLPREDASRLVVTVTTHPCLRSWHAGTRSGRVRSRGRPEPLGVYIDWKGVKSAGTSLPANFALSSALGSPRISP